MTTRLPYMLIMVSLLSCSALYSGEQSQVPDNKVPRIDRQMLISIPPVLEPLKRAPVIFRHDEHATALKEEGCQVCHPRKNSRFDFSFPKQRDETSHKALRDSFHDSCIECHSRRAAARKKTGPMTCGECHAKQAYKVTPAGPYANLDYYTHDRHVKAINDESLQTLAQGFMTEYSRGMIPRDSGTKANNCRLCHNISSDQERSTTVRKKNKRKVTHQLCLNCHLAFLTEKKTGGPVNCKDCHTGRMRSVIEMRNVSHPDIGTRERMLIKADGGEMAAVPFDHKAHIAISRSCTDCHHKTLESCNKCHTLGGAEKGNFVTLKDAYHKTGSGKSCAGCHEQEKQKPDCAGCHHLRKSGLAGSSCTKCHTGDIASLDRVSRLPDPSSLFMPGMKDVFEITILEKEFKPARIKHRLMAEKLTGISNNSRLAAFFHQKETTICSGCHHASAVEKNQKPTSCRACHEERNGIADEKPSLLGAYHQQCLGCHIKMEYRKEEMPQDCSGCHMEKKNQLTNLASGIISERNHNNAGN